MSTRRRKWFLLVYVGAICALIASRAPYIYDYIGLYNSIQVVGAILITMGGIAIIYRFRARFGFLAMRGAILALIIFQSIVIAVILNDI